MHLFAFALAVAALPPAGPGAFDAAKVGAVELERPAQAVTVLVGACGAGDGAVDGECLQNTKAMKERVAGKRVLLDLGGGFENFLGFAARNGAVTRFVWGPLYDVGNGLALTVGKPQKLDADGNIVVGRRPVDGTSPDDLMDSDLQRLCKTGQAGIQVVGKLGKPWTLGSGDKAARGITFEVEALRLYNVRTGATIFESTQPLK